MASHTICVSSAVNVHRPSARIFAGAGSMRYVWTVKAAVHDMCNFFLFTIHTLFELHNVFSFHTFNTYKPHSISKIIFTHVYSYMYIMYHYKVLYRDMCITQYYVLTWAIRHWEKQHSSYEEVLVIMRKLGMSHWSSTKWIQLYSLKAGDKIAQAFLGVIPSYDFLFRYRTQLSHQSIIVMWLINIFKAVGILQHLHESLSSDWWIVDHTHWIIHCHWFIYLESSVAQWWELPLHAFIIQYCWVMAL